MACDLGLEGTGTTDASLDALGRKTSRRELRSNIGAPADRFTPVAPVDRKRSATIFVLAVVLMLASTPVRPACAQTDGCAPIPWDPVFQLLERNVDSAHDTLSKSAELQKLPPDQALMRYTAENDSLRGTSCMLGLLQRLKTVPDGFPAERFARVTNRHHEAASRLLLLESVARLQAKSDDKPGGGGGATCNTAAEMACMEMCKALNSCCIKSGSMSCTLTICEWECCE